MDSADSCTSSSDDDFSIEDEEDEGKRNTLFSSRTFTCAMAKTQRRYGYRHGYHGHGHLPFLQFRCVPAVICWIQLSPTHPQNRCANIFSSNTCPPVHFPGIPKVYPERNRRDSFEVMDLVRTSMHASCFKRFINTTMLRLCKVICTILDFINYCQL